MCCILNSDRLTLRISYITRPVGSMFGTLYALDISESHQGIVAPALRETLTYVMPWHLRLNHFDYYLYDTVSVMVAVPS